MPTVSSLPQATASPCIQFISFTYCTSQLARAVSKPRYFKGELSPFYREGVSCVIPHSPQHIQREPAAASPHRSRSGRRQSCPQGCCAHRGIPGSAPLPGGAGQGSSGSLPPPPKAAPPQGQTWRTRRRLARSNLPRTSPPPPAFTPGSASVSHLHGEVSFQLSVWSRR